MEIKNLALKFAIKLLTLRRRSVFEIKTRLQKKGYESDIIKQVIEDLNSYKYLDDEAFAESYINDRMNFRPCGRFIIKKELKERGISENIIERKIEELISIEQEIKSAKKLATQKSKTISEKIEKNKAIQKVKAYLQSKGFSFDVINQAVKNKNVYHNIAEDSESNSE
ncbi:MAG: regulatory protein RecX [Candidatus Pacebacteria bacterium]|nr:regulatory protein RecX [Candidatus Paceibacterota bacterium]